MLVSHQLQHIKNCDKVVLLENGKIQASGSFEDVMQAPGSHFAETMREFVNGEHVEVEEIQDAKDTEKMLDAIEATRPAEVASEHDNKNEEKSHVGTVGLSVYFNYFKAGRSAFLLFLLILVIVLGEFFLIASTYWLSRWSQQDADIQDTNQALNLYIFIGLVLATIAASMVRAAWFYLNALRAGRILFVDMLASVFRSPIDFFHSNPHGRIMK